MSKDQKSMRLRVRSPDLPTHLGTASRTCKVPGYSRDGFHR